MRRMGIVLAFIAASAGFVLAQGRGGAQPPKTAKEAAPVDITGTWVSVVTEDWRWRMVTPLKGDSASVPVNAAARKVIESWDPAKDEAAGLQCKSYGAPAIMRVPGRVRISWQDDNTLKLEADSGNQVRVFHFGGNAPEKLEPSWQGYSVARWEQPLRPPEASGLGVVRTGNAGRALEVDTTNLRDGYLRKNGVPYSSRATLKEYFERHKEHDGTEWFTVTSIVTDPEFLAVPFVTSSDFRREPNDSKFNPSPCTAR